jgi:hypothetical protein
MNPEQMRRWWMGSVGGCCLLGLGAWLVCGMASCGICKPDFSGFWQTDLDRVRQDKAGAIVSYEVKSGVVLVSLADRVGDCHVFRLDHPGKSTQETLEILKQTQTEQTKTKPNSTPDGTRQPAGGSPRPPM